MKSNTLKAGLLMVLASTVAVGSVGTAVAGEYHAPDHHAMKDKRDGSIKRMLRNLDLTAAQKEQVKKLVKAANEAKKADRQAKREQLYAVISAKNFDEAKAQALVAAGSPKDKHQLQAVNKLKLQNAIYQILTPEQQQKFKDNFIKVKVPKKVKAEQ